jgi:hypothetical protein
MAAAEVVVVAVAVVVLLALRSTERRTDRYCYAEAAST